jgi:uncharacterized protein
MNIALRVTVFWLCYAGIFIGLGLVLGLAPPSGRLLLAGIIVSAASILLTYLFTVNERLSPADVGAAWSRGSLRRFGVGLLFGCAMVGCLVALSRIAFGPVTFVRTAAVGPSSVALMSLTFVALSAGEELGFRGYPFRRLRDRYGVVTAQVVVALAFALYHVFQGWPLMNALVGTTAGSVMFGVATIVSRGLAFPIGVHAAWNLVSWLLGTKNEAGYWHMELSNPASPVVGAAVYLTVMAISTLALWCWMRRYQFPESIA